MTVWGVIASYDPDDNGHIVLFLSEAKARESALGYAQADVLRQYQGELEWRANRLVPKGTKNIFPESWIGVRPYEVIE